MINPSLSIIKCMWIKLFNAKAEWTKNIIQLYAV